VTALRVPPFAARHRAAARAGFAPRNHICIYVGWPPKHRVPPIYKYAAWKAAVPPDVDPATFDWTWCAGCDVFIIGGGKSTQIAEAISPVGTRNTIILQGSSMVIAP
jgi:hypothetical protein